MPSHRPTSTSDIPQVTDSAVDGSAFEQPLAGALQSGESFSVRAAQLPDLLDVATVITEAFHPAGDWLAWLAPVLRLGIYQDLRQRLLSRAGGYTCLVNCLGSHWQSCLQTSPAPIAGTVEIQLRPISLQFGSPSTVEQPYLSNLAVHPHYRRRGIAAHLLLASEETARGWGFEDLYLHVLENNTAARHLYTRLGYRLRQTDFPWATLLGQPRQLLLHKHLR